MATNPVRGTAARAESRPTLVSYRRLAISVLDVLAGNSGLQSVLRSTFPMRGSAGDNRIPLSSLRELRVV